MRSLCILHRTPATVGFSVLVAALIVAPVGQAGLISTPVHPVVIGGMTPDGNGHCVGQFTITTDHPADFGWVVSLLYHLDANCQPVVDSITSDPAPRLDSVPHEEGEGSGGPQTYISEAHGTFTSQETISCGEEDCATSTQTLKVDDYQQWHKTSSGVAGDNSAVQCSVAGGLTLNRCDKFLGSQEGTEISMSGHGEGGWTDSFGRGYTLTGDVTLYTNSAGGEQPSCSIGGSAPSESQGICSNSPS